MKCKRCGSDIDVLDHICKGCGKSIIALREDNEIAYEGEPVEVEVIAKEEPKQSVIEEPVKESLDVFGDAIFGVEEPKEAEIPVDSSPVVPEVIPEPLVDYSPNIEAMPSTDVVEEVISAEPLEKNEVTDAPVFEEVPPVEEIVEEINIPVKPLDTPIPSVTPTEIKINTEDKVFDDSFIEKRKKKSKAGIILVILAFIILLISGAFYYLYTMNSPMKVFKNLIEDIKLSDSNVETIKQMKTELSLKLEIENTKSDKFFELINDLNLNVKTHVDIVGEKAYISLNSIYKGNSLVDAEAYMVNDEMYLFFKDIFDKYIKTSYLTETLFMSDNINADLVSIFEELKKELANSLDKKNFERKIEKLNNEYVFNSILNFNGETFSEFLKKFLGNIKNNNKIITSLATSYDMTSEDIKIKIDEFINDVDPTMVDNFKISLYTSILKGDLKKAVVSVKKDEIKTETTVDVNDDSYIITFSTNEEDISDVIVTIIEKSENDCDIIVTTNNPSAGKIKITLNMKYNYNEELVIPDLSNSVEDSELTDEEREEIIVNFLERDGVVQIYDFIRELFTGNEEDNFDNEVQDL